MDSSSSSSSSTTITREQRRLIFFAAARHRDWAKKLTDRARETGWPAGDPVLAAADAAAAALQALVREIAASGETGDPLPTLAPRWEEMARRKRGVP